MKRIVPTICQMCYYYCGLQVTVEDDRIVKVEGLREHPVSHGHLCVRGLTAGQLVDDPARIKTPLIRDGERGSGKWKRITWDEALDTIASNLIDIRDKLGPEYVGFFRGHAPGWVTNYNYVHRFINSWGTPNLFIPAHLCFTPRAVAHVATFGSYPEPDFERSNCIMLLGYNPVNTSTVNYAARIVWAKERGAKLIVVDPRFTNTAAKAGLFLQPRPGTIGALVLSMINVLIREELFDADFVEKWTVGFDRIKELVKDYPPERAEAITWVPAEKIVQAVHLLVRNSPSVIVDGNGLDQQTNVVQTVRATSVLRSLLRTVDEPGGSILMPSLPFIDVQLRGSRTKEFLEKAVLQYPLFFRAGNSMTGVELTDSLSMGKPYKIQTLIVQGGNPVSVMSDTNAVRNILKELGLIVVHDLYLTATAQIADIVLPAASFLERDLVLYYRYRPFADGNLICMQNCCLPPVGESKSDIDFIFALAKRVGLDEYFPWSSAVEAFDWELEPNHIDVEWLRGHPEGFVKRYTPQELYRKYEKQGFHTPSKKIELVSSVFQDHGYDPVPTYKEPSSSPVDEPELAERYPFICSLGIKLGIHTHTQFRSMPSIRKLEPDPFGEIHPSTAAALGIEDGDWMVIETPKGAIRVRARITEAVHPKVIMGTFGYGEPYADKHDLTNTITDEENRDPICGTTNNRAFMCNVRKAQP